MVSQGGPCFINVRYAPLACKFNCIGIVGDCFLEDGVEIKVDEVKLFDSVSRVISKEGGVRMNENVAAKVRYVVCTYDPFVEPVYKLFGRGILDKLRNSHSGTFYLLEKGRGSIMGCDG